MTALIKRQFQIVRNIKSPIYPLGMGNTKDAIYQISKNFSKNMVFSKYSFNITRVYIQGGPIKKEQMRPIKNYTPVLINISTICFPLTPESIVQR